MLKKSQVFGFVVSTVLREQEIYIGPSSVFGGKRSVLFAVASNGKMFAQPTAVGSIFLMLCAGVVPYASEVI